VEQTSDETRPAAASTLSATDAGGAALFECLGVGGMGEVYRCGDDALQRDLAVKILKAELRGDAVAEERFLREARLTGSMQHPGIVPIHNLSRLADGRPCYTMKLVRGRTFAEMLRQEPDGPERLPRLLAVLEKMCQAMAFAHSKGVLHRDLKPSNVMVGEFGEVQVMDWGLAKELSRDEPVSPDEATENVETVARTEEKEGLSRGGAALGTPAYMPPEQAAGDWDIVDERADVFALGSVLCEVLTGRPPYHGANRDDLLRRARRGDVAESLGRLEKCGADAALVDLCRACLAAELLQRPRHAGVVAERLASYQAEVRERLRQAELERARAEVKAREERKRRRLLAVLALAGLLLLVGGVAVWRQRQQRRAEADAAVAEALDETRRLRQQAQTDPLTAIAYDNVVSSARKAAEMARAGGAAEPMQRQADDLLVEVKQEAKELAKDRRLLARLLEARGPHEGPKYSRDIDPLMALAAPTAEELFASAFREWGLDMDATPITEAVARLKARPRAVGTEVIAALDEWTCQRRLDKKPEAEWRRLADLAAALDDDPGSLRRELRTILAKNQLARERALAVLSAALRPVPVPAIVPLGKDHLRLRQLAERIDPALEPVLGLLTLTRALQAAGEEALAERLLRSALTARPREVVLYHTLGQLLGEQKPPRWADAVGFYWAARGLRPDLGVTLATALRHSGHAGEGLDLLARMSSENPDNPYLLFERGLALFNQKNYGEAEAAYRQAIALRPDYAEPHVSLGAILCDFQSKSVEAEELFRTAIALKSDYAIAYHDLGVSLKRQGKPGEAEAAFRKALELKPDFAEAYNNLGAILCDHQGKYGEAEAAMRKAIELRPDFAIAYHDLGVTLELQGKYVEAEAACRKAIELKPGYVRAYSLLGEILVNQGKLVEGEETGRKAIALKPDYAGAHYCVGFALERQGKPVEAEEAYRKAIALKPDHAAEVHCNLGSVLRSQGRYTESLAAYRRGHELGSKQSVWRYPSLRWVREVEPLAELENKLPALLSGETKPANVQDMMTVARMATHYHQQFLATVRFLEQSLAANPDWAEQLPADPPRYYAACCAAMAAAGKDPRASALDAEARRSLRQRAVSWLGEELNRHRKQVAKGVPADRAALAKALAFWKEDGWLAAVHDSSALAKLPADEQQACRKLWADVDELAKRVANK
jgi:serine/threonine-protein kinase